ncbi:hypothetical protein D3C87_2099350 [compost metagenome]
MNGDVREAITLDRKRAEIEQLPGLPGVPQPDFLTVRLGGNGHDVFFEPEREENARAIGTDLDARADFLQFDCLFIDVDIETLAEQ